jgi:hypothetical protein
MSLTNVTTDQSPRKGADRTLETPTPVAVRWVGGVIVFFLIDAVQLLLLVPDRSSQLFAWPIAPDFSAYVLASAYSAGAYFFVRVAMGASWNRVVAGFAPVTVFVWLVAIATLLHLDRFREGSLPFLAWITLYVLSPFGIPLIAVLASRAAGADGGGERLPQALRIALGVAGGVVVAAALWVFADPVAFAGDLPWPMTPLTTRVVMSVIALFGSVWVSVAVDGRRTAATIVLEAHVVGLAVMLGALVIAGVPTGQPLAPVLLGGGAAMLVTSAVVRVKWGATRGRVMR